jgi:predicted nucleic acid-binding protein
VPGIVYDTGALLAAERGSVALATLHLEVTRTGSRPVVPAVVLAQAWRGGPQPRLSRLMKGCYIVPDDERLARAAGTICAAARTSDVVDALVVALAAALGSSVVTSDPGDIQHLADAAGAPITVHRI